MGAKATDSFYIFIDTTGALNLCLRNREISLMFAFCAVRLIRLTIFRIKVTSLIQVLKKFIFLFVHMKGYCKFVLR